MLPTSRRTPVRRRVWNLGRLFILMAALGATFAVFFLTAMRVTSRARDVEVPNLYGKSIDEARVLLASRGLTVRVEEGRRADKTVPPDHVLTQEPAPGQIVRRQRAIRVRLSDGMRAAALPLVTDFPERTAEITLESDRISVGYKAEIRSADYKPGVVVSQDPPAQRP
jgi:beta-lactam-binding protein with PASTA domain